MRIISCLFFVLFCCTSLSAQDRLELGFYSPAPTCTPIRQEITLGDYIGAMSSKRYADNNVTRFKTYKIKSNGDTIPYMVVELYESGYEKQSTIEGKKFALHKEIPEVVRLRDSIITTYEKAQSVYRDTMIAGTNGFCKETSWYNDKGKLIKEKGICGFIAPEANAKYEFEYDDKGRLTKTTRYTGTFSFHLKFGWSIGFVYDQNGLLLEKQYLNKKGNITSREIYIYEYREK